MGYPTAIVLGIDTPIGLTVVRELGRQGVPVHGIGRAERAIGRASRYCRSFSIRPADVALAEWLPGLIARTKAGALLAISESDLLMLAALPAVIDGCRILTPRAAALALVLDKRSTLDSAEPLGFDVPSTWQPEADEDFASRAAALSYPVVLKWADPPSIMHLLERSSVMFEKAEFASSSGPLLAILERYRPIGRWPMVQTYCRGIGLGQMLFMADGRATLTFQHRRLHEWPPEGGVSTLCQAEPLNRHRAQMKRSGALLAAIGWEGPAMVEYRYDDAADRYWLMEINGRFWGSLPLAWHCGATFAWEGYRRAVLGNRTPPPRPRADLRARYMIPETRRLLRVALQREKIADPFFTPRPWRDVAHYLLGFVDPRMRYYVFSWRDPGPFLADLASVVRKALRRGNP